MIVHATKILSYLRRALAWISARFFKRKCVRDAPDGKSETGVVASHPRLVIIDKPAHPNNYGDRPVGIEISLIVLHYTASGSLDATVRWFQDPEAKASAHYVIGRDGTIVRMVPEEKKAYHAGESEWNGRKDANQFSIGIELVNWGKLEKRDDRFFTWPKEYTNPYTGLEPVFLENAWWEPYPDAQIASLEPLIDDIKQRHPINAVVGHRDVSLGRKLDPGPMLKKQV